MAYYSIAFLRNLAKIYGYTLRRKGQKQEHTAVYDGFGEQLRTCYVPHLVCTPSVRARTIKLYEEARKQIMEHFGVECIEWCDVYEMLLLMNEHVIRNMKYKTNGLDFSCNLFYLIDKEDYIRRAKERKAAKKGESNAVEIR